MIDEKLFPFRFWLVLSHCTSAAAEDLDFNTLFGHLLENHLECPEYPFPVLVDLSRRIMAGKTK